MKRLRSPLLLTAVMLAALMAGCGGAGSTAGPNANVLAVVKGLVTRANGTAFAGVTVRSGTTTTTSQPDGSYSLSLSPGADLRVGASKSGCVDTFEILSLSAGQTVPLNFALNTIGQSTGLTNLLTTPATVIDSRGTEVMLAANTLVDSTGTAVDSATLEVTTALPSDTSFTASFPGLFIGTKAGSELDIESFGFVTVNVTSTTGLACNLKSGATAGLAIPVAPGSDPGTPTIDLWSLDENTGKWTFVAQATRDTSGATTVYRAQVTHFSTYNLDQAIASSMPFTVTVQNAAGNAVVGASVVVTSTNQTGGGMWEGRGVTGANGAASFPNVPQGFVAVHALSGSLAGVGYGYNVTNGVATLTITLFVGVQRTFTAVYLNNGVQTPIPNLNLGVSQGSSLNAMGAGGLTVHGITNSSGQATLSLQDGHAVYIYSANTTIGGINYAINGTVSTPSQIPATWVLTP